MKEIKNNIFRYQGRSMWPCFQEGDLLEFLPCSLQDINVGDSVVYATDDQRHVTHRVMAKSDALTTRGDAMPNVDNEVITADQIMGKIVQRYRLGKVSKVNGGLAGWLTGRFYHFAGRIDPQRNAIGGSIARGLRIVSMAGFKQFWDRGRKRVLIIGEEETVVFWMIGKKAIGKRSAHSKEWKIAWPWSIVVTIKADQ